MGKVRIIIMSMSTFKAKNFRYTKSTQYADQLWLKTVGTIATAWTYGQSDSLRVAFLGEDSTAVPAVFGSMSWTAPLSSPSQCTIKLLDGSDMLAAMTIEPSKTTVTGLTVNGNVHLPFLPNAATGHVVSFNPSTGKIGYMESGRGDGSFANVTITESLSLPNLPTFRTPYALYVEPTTGILSKAEAPYAVSMSGGNASVSFSGNVTAASVSVNEGVQLGSGNEVWRLRPDTGSGLLSVEKLEGNVWVTKSSLGT